MFRQFHGRVKRTYQAILHDTGHRQGASAVRTEVSLDGQGGRIGCQVQRSQRLLRGYLLVLRSTPSASLVNSGGGHRLFPSR